MAWLQNLAGKAEDLLVKFDQNAANVLNDQSLPLLGYKDYVHSDIDPSHNDNPSDKSDTNVIIQLDTKSDDGKKWFQQDSFVDNTDGAGSNISVTSENPTAPSSEESAVTTLSRSVNQDVYSPVSYDVIESISSGLRSDFLPKSNQTSFISVDESAFKYEENLLQLQRENEELNQQLMNMRHLYSEMQNENSNLQNQLERANEALGVTQREMEQYRARAQRILQEKEKLINNSNKDTVSENQIMVTYNEELNKELKFQEEKCKELSIKLLKANKELAAFQQNFVAAQKEHHASKQVLQDTVMNERKIRSAIEEEFRSKTKDLQSALHELSQKNSIIANKSQEISGLQEQLKQRSNHIVNEDVESRLQSLTSVLIAKQNAIETVTTERNALRLQLEKLENEHGKLLVQLQKSRQKTSVASESEEVKLQVPQLFQVSPFDAGVTQKVKRAYSCLDAISIRTGVFLRRYPFARVFVFCYMILLHFWVLFVLCTYVPGNS